MPSSVMTPEVLETVLTAVQTGLGIKTAAEYAGIGERTVKDWLAKGRAAIEASEDNDAPVPEEDRAYADFAREVDRKRATAIARNITNIQSAGARGAPVMDRQGRVVRDEEDRIVFHSGDWRASAWWLERMYPAEFGQRVELSGELNGTQTHVLGPADAQIAMDQAADPNRTAAVARALAEAGILVHPEAIETTADDTDG